MSAVEQALEAGDRDGFEAGMTDEWLADCTLYGSVAEVPRGRGVVRDGHDADHRPLVDVRRPAQGHGGVPRSDGLAAGGMSPF